MPYIEIEKARENGRKRSQRYRKAHPERVQKNDQKSRRNYGKRLKTQTLAHYGKNGILCCRWRNCSIHDIDMLTIDHINNDGAIHRKKVGGVDRRDMAGMQFYCWLRRHNFPEGFQTLCANHQLKKELQKRREKRK